MASFQKKLSKNGAINWRVQIFVNGVRESKSGFNSKPDAKLWAAQREIELLSCVDNTANNLVAAHPEIKTPIRAVITYKTLVDAL